MQAIGSLVDFTPHLGQLRHNHSRFVDLIGSSRVVFCLGSRALLSFAVSASPHPDQILGAATTEEESLRLVDQRRPDLLLASDHLEEGCGVDLVVAVKRRFRRIRILLLVTQSHRLGRARRAVEAHCDGILLESRFGLGTELTALRSVCAGDSFIDRQIHRMPLNEGLSDRETEILQRLATGDKNGEIASGLLLSIDTVKTHIRNLQMKLQARDRTHAVAIGMRLGLVD